MNKYLTAVAGVTVGFGVLAGIALAGPIEDRQKLMKEGVLGGMKQLVAIAKGKAEFDAATVKSAATQIKTSLEKAGPLFVKGTGVSSGAKTRAKDEIWTDMAGFDAALKAAIAAAGNMAGVTDKSAFGAAMMKVGAGCKGCHEKFRAPKKE